MQTQNAAPAKSGVVEHNGTPKATDFGALAALLPQTTDAPAEEPVFGSQDDVDFSAEFENYDDPKGALGQGDVVELSPEGEETQSWVFLGTKKGDTSTYVFARKSIDGQIIQLREEGNMEPSEATAGVTADVESPAADQAKHDAARGITHDAPAPKAEAQPAGQHPQPRKVRKQAQPAAKPQYKVVVPQVVSRKTERRPEREEAPQGVASIRDLLLQSPDEHGKLRYKIGEGGLAQIALKYEARGGKPTLVVFKRAHGKLAGYVVLGLTVEENRREKGRYIVYLEVVEATGFYAKAVELKGRVRFDELLRGRPTPPHRAERTVAILDIILDALGLKQGAEESAEAGK